MSNKSFVEMIADWPPELLVALHIQFKIAEMSDVGGYEQGFAAYDRILQKVIKEFESPTPKERT